MGKDQQKQKDILTLSHTCETRKCFVFMAELQNACDGCANHAEDDGGGQGYEKFTAKQTKAQISWQAPKAELVQPRREALNQEERQKNNQQPTNHVESSKAMGAIGLHKTHGCPRFTTSDGHDFEQLTHLMILNQFLRHAAFWHAGVLQQRQQTTVE